MTTASGVRVLDVRSLPGPAGTEAALGMFDALPPGETLTLVSASPLPELAKHIDVVPGAAGGAGRGRR